MDFTPIKNTKYEINKNGEVRRVFKNGNISFLKHHINKQNNYFYVSIDSKKKSLHRLLMETFCENPENKPCVDHIDRNRQNNNLENLRWVTYQENNCNKNTNGSVYKTLDKVNGKIYEGYRATYYLNQQKISKRFKTEDQCYEWLRNNLT